MANTAELVSQYLTLQASLGESLEELPAWIDGDAVCVVRIVRGRAVISRLTVQEQAPAQVAELAQIEHDLVEALKGNPLLFRRNGKVFRARVVKGQLQILSEGAHEIAEI